MHLCSYSLLSTTTHQAVIAAQEISSRDKFCAKVDSLVRMVQVVSQGVADQYHLWQQLAIGAVFPCNLLAAL